MSSRRFLPVLVTLACALLAPTAEGNVYSHFACMYPNGRSGAPISDGANGWRAVGKDIAGYTAYDDCANGGAFGVRLARDATSHAADSYGWRYFPPVGTSVAGFSIAMTSFADPNLGEVDVAQDGDRYFYRNIHGGDQGSSGSPVLVEAKDLTPAGGPLIWGSCDVSDCSPAAGQDIARFLVYHARVDLQDSSGPSGSVSGAATTAARWSQTVRLAAKSDDTGGGVYRLFLNVDDKTVQRSPASSSASCQDAEPDNANPYEFASPKPCPDSAATTLDLDTRAIPDGDHKIAVVAEDAAGNRTPIFGPVVKTIDNAVTAGQSALIVSPTLRLNAISAHTHSSQILVRYGHRPVLVGTLRDQRGVPLAGGVVRVTARTEVPGAVFHPIGAVTTDARGRFRYVVPAGPSRLIRFVHERREGDLVRSGSDDVLVRVRARVTLSTKRARLRNGQAVTFRGRVLGLRPGERKVVELRVRAGSRWMTFATTRTRRGVFHLRYRFTRTSGKVVYRFSARVRAETGFPYATGSSRTLPVTVYG